MTARVTSDLPLVDRLFDLPPHLMKTYLAVIIIDYEVNATDVSDLTKRPRALESSYLNQLTLLGLLNKRRQKRIALFTIKRQNCPQKEDTP